MSESKELKCVVRHEVMCKRNVSKGLAFRQSRLNIYSLLALKKAGTRKASFIQSFIWSFAF